MFNAAGELRARGRTVFDLSLGNPDLEPPAVWNESLVALLRNAPAGQHRYMNSRGIASVRQFIARRESARYGLPFELDDVTMTVGAAGALNVVFRTLLDPGDEVLTPAPYFTEYRNYAANNDARLITAPTSADFSLDVDALLSKISERTRILLLNSPNNPSGAVYDAASLAALARGLERLASPRLFVVEDTPYRDLMHDGSAAPSLLGQFPATLLIGSHSKDLGLAGERIGYLLSSPEIVERRALHQAFEHWQRTLGFVNAPALMQRSLEATLGKPGATVDVASYARRCQWVAGQLAELGFVLPRPRAGFFLFARLPDSFVPAPGFESRDVAFCTELAREACLAVPGVAFGCADHVRLALCGSDETLAGALAAFRTVLRSR